MSNFFPEWLLPLLILGAPLLLAIVERIRMPAVDLGDTVGSRRLPSAA